MWENEESINSIKSEYIATCSDIWTHLCQVVFHSYNNVDKLQQYKIVW